MANSHPEKSFRKRRLSVIYFVDSAKTRSFTLSIGVLNFILGILLSMVLWTAASGFIFYWVAQERKLLTNRLSQTLDTVFEFETRHNGVYEIAYPASSSGGVAAKDLIKTQAELLSNSDREQSGKESVAAKEVASGPSAPTKEASTEREVKEKEEPKPTIGSDQVEDLSPSFASIERPVISQEKNFISLKFRIVNTNTPKRAEGYIWAVCEFVDSSGKTNFLPDPLGIQIDENGIARFPNRSYRFSIKRYTAKKFKFAYGAEWQGSFKVIHVGLLNKKSGKVETYDIPVNIDIKPNSEEASESPTSDPAQDGGKPDFGEIAGQK
jgi:hypothetical protein